MSTRAIREYDGKRLVAAHTTGLSHGSIAPIRVAQVKAILFHENQKQTVPTIDPAATTVPNEKVQLSKSELSQQLRKTFCSVEETCPWLLTSGMKLVVKPDQLIKRRGKAGMILLNSEWSEAKEWIIEKAGSEISVDGVQGIMKNWIVEPFIPHEASSENYISIQSVPKGDLILYSDRGGVDVGNVDEHANKLFISCDQTPTTEELKNLANGNKIICAFIAELWNTYDSLYFTLLEINPFCVINEEIYILDMAAKLDQCAEYECQSAKWLGGVEFPAPFGRELCPEEAYIAELDSKTGASLKLTILNAKGRVWTMVAGGGASVAYSDAIAAHGMASELANYGEYSGAPSETQTFEYAKTILDLMTRGTPHPQGKILFIGGGIANFTNVATTFKGIIRALTEYKHRLHEYSVAIWVRRAGPNYQEGLRMIRECGDFLNIPMHVYGPETHITSIVPMALKGVCEDGRPISDVDDADKASNLSSDFLEQLSLSNSRCSSPVQQKAAVGAAKSDTSFVEVEEGQCGGREAAKDYRLFAPTTKAFVFGMQQRAVQGMLDYDYICKRKEPSVSAIIYPFGGDHVMKFYWGTKEILVPVYARFEDACQKHPSVSVCVNFASCRSVPETCLDIINNHFGQIKTIAIIAEGIPEKHTKRINCAAEKHGVMIIGPATVGGLRAGSFKIGNTGGMIDNIVMSRLYRPGSVCYVSKSGGMSNELNNIIARKTDGVLEGIAIGGDRYPGSTFIDHVLRFESDPACKMIVLLGEVGGSEEYRVCEAVKSGRIKKPIIAWCIGVCAEMLGTEVQFGHAGAMANSQLETAVAKNSALSACGITVPPSFEELPFAIGQVYKDLVKDGKIVPAPEPERPKVPIDYSWAQELGIIRKPAQFVSTICDDRGQELLYAGMPISSVFKEEIGIGGVLSLLWFKRRLPDWSCRFIEMVLMLTADHGPAVSGAHNTIVAARAGKDLVSSLASGMLTIGDRFGGALDGAAEQFSAAYDQGLTPIDFVLSMRKQHKLIMGIGHRIKSLTNPDLRVTILKKFAKEYFPCTPLLDFALQVEKLTTAKKDNLILNVDGATAVLFVDLLRHSGAFTRSEADEYAKIGTLNGLFVLGRSIGFIGHYLDQKRLKQGLYRHPWDDISYLNPTMNDQSRYQN